MTKNLEGQQDFLRLWNWKVRVGIGAWDSEKHRRQTLRLDVKLFGDFHEAAETDRLDLALDYSRLKTDYEAFVSQRRWELLESFALQSAEFFLRSRLVSRVEFTVTKPKAVAPALVSYTLVRFQSTENGS
jgi:dihydroneopterin aldolase